MDTQPHLGPQDLLTHVVSDVAEAVSARDGETRQRQDNRQQAAASTILSFMPRDAVEAMLAGHCVMFHALIVDSVHVTLRDEAPSTRRATRAGIAAMDKAFGDNLARLARYRKAQGAARAGEEGAETEIADRVSRHQSGTRAASTEIAGEAEIIPHVPPPRPIADGSDTISGDARAVGQPNVAYLSGAAAVMAGLNRQTRREIGRRARRLIVPAPT
jgi:hypothetical protein